MKNKYQERRDKAFDDFVKNDTRQNRIRAIGLSVIYILVIILLLIYIL